MKQKYETGRDLEITQLDNFGRCRDLTSRWVDVDVPGYFDGGPPRAPFFGDDHRINT